MITMPRQQIMIKLHVPVILNGRLLIIFNGLFIMTMLQAKFFLT